MTFKAKIHGTFPISYAPSSTPADTTIKFTKYKIKITDDQKERLYLDPMLVRLIVNDMPYEFDKRLNKADKRMFSILVHKLNLIDDGLFHLDISFWNKIKANLLHNRYWLFREKDFLYKAILTAIVGFIFAIIGRELGYSQGYAAGVKAAQESHQLVRPK